MKCPVYVNNMIHCKALLHNNNKTKQSYTQLDSRKQVIAFQERRQLYTKKAQHGLK